MKIYDITQPLFECTVFPGDPAPEKRIVMKISEGAVCNLSEFSMCAHNGTHVDSPYHFYDDGKIQGEVYIRNGVIVAYNCSEQYAKNLYNSAVSYLQEFEKELSQQ